MPRCRMRDVRRVTSLRLAYRQSDLRHTEAREDNYIYAPKESGYRGIHLIYRYKSDKNATYNGLLIELQLRSQLQHAWATAVETVGTFLQQSLKASEGSDLWLRFFALAGGVFAKVERTPPVPGTPNELADLRVEAKALEKSLNVHRVLKAYGDALTVISAGAATKAAKYYLLELFPTKEEVRVTPFRAGELKRATEGAVHAGRDDTGRPARAGRACFGRVCRFSETRIPQLLPGHGRLPCRDPRRLEVAEGFEGQR